MVAVAGDRGAGFFAGLDEGGAGWCCVSVLVHCLFFSCSMGMHTRHRHLVAIDGQFDVRVSSSGGGESAGLLLLDGIESGELLQSPQRTQSLPPHHLAGVTAESEGERNAVERRGGGGGNNVALISSTCLTSKAG